MHIPVSTYRLQLNQDFGFKDAAGIVPYLHWLGISDVYLSPVLSARKGSSHGYDVVDPRELNPELGTMEDFGVLADTADRHRMHLIADTVPNHMAFDSQNTMLMDVLEKGDRSDYFHYFDIQWDHHLQQLKGKLMAPVLGDQVDACLSRGGIALVYAGSGFSFNYYSHRLPASVFTYREILSEIMPGSTSDRSCRYAEGGFSCREKLKSVLELAEQVENSGLSGFQKKAEQVKKELWELYCRNTGIKEIIDRRTEHFNHSPFRMKELLSRQFFRLCFWKQALNTINYRRFFDINDLICINVEKDQVFNHTHQLLFHLVEQHKLKGLRIDHIDGLHDPAEYLRRLRTRCPDIYVITEKILGWEEQLPEEWPAQGTTGYDFLNYVNGVFCRKENQQKLSRVYTSFTGSRASFSTTLYRNKKLIAEKYLAGDVENLAHQALSVLEQVERNQGNNSRCSVDRMEKALVEVASCFPVYRTYISQHSCTQQDRKYIKKAVTMSLQKAPSLLQAIKAVEKLLLCKQRPAPGQVQFIMKFQEFTGPLMAKGFEDTTLYVYNRLTSLNEVGGFPDRFGVALAQFHRFLQDRTLRQPNSMNALSTHDTKRGEDARARINVLSEIPDHWGKKLTYWSSINRRYKKTLNGKLSPDSNEEYLLYQTLVGTFPFYIINCQGHSSLDFFRDCCSTGKFSDKNNHQPYHRNYQVFVKRVQDYLVKALREAKVNSCWDQPDSEYEASAAEFVERILTAQNQEKKAAEGSPKQTPPKEKPPEQSNLFLQDLIPFTRKIAYCGACNSLSQKLIKLAAPGVPDIYQGSELWNLTLVDPDNRQPVDYHYRRALGEEIQNQEKRRGKKALAEHLFSELNSIEAENGKIKLYVVHQTLQTRKNLRDVFQKGAYIPLPILGKLKNHLVCFSRCFEGKWGIAVAPRFFTALIAESTRKENRSKENRHSKTGFTFKKGVWSGTCIKLPENAPGMWRDIYTDTIIKTDQLIRVEEVLESFPVSFLVSE
ncbi:MAG: malto-oligosyltrehalose synthase [Spirochaetota bacterium]